MGLTIHFDLSCRSRKTDAARTHALVERMRQLAMDLPFDGIGNIIELRGHDCDCERWRDQRDTNKEADSKFGLALDGHKLVRSPWNPRSFFSVNPTRIIAFEINVGPGSEWMTLGLAQYPETIAVTYDPHDDARFVEEVRECRSRSWRFSYRKWDRWYRKNGCRWATPYDERFREIRHVPVKRSGWSWGSFCKTQYASDPAAGGVPNFLRCHISVITLLDRIATIPTIKVEINDEGKYARSHYSDDWQEADAAGRERTYVWHDGKYNVVELIKEVGEWNEMIAGMFGALRDVVQAVGDGKELVGPIQNYQNFEQLEFKGQRKEAIGPFLRGVSELAETERRKHMATESNE